MRRFLKAVIFTALAMSAVFSARAESDSLCTEYIMKALEYNRGLKAAGYNTELKRFEENAAKADLLPKISASGNVSYTGNPLSLTLDIPSLNGPVEFNGRHMNYGTALSAVQPVYTGGSLKSACAVAQSESEIAWLNESSVYADVWNTADKIYWRAVAARELLEVACAYEKSVSDLAGVINDRVETDYADRSDLLMAQVKLNDARYRVLLAQKNFEVACMAMNSYIGENLEAPVALDSCVIPAYTTEGLEKYIAGAAMNRQETLIASEKRTLARSEKKHADSQFLPQIQIGAEGEYSSPGYNLQGGPDPNYGIYAKISIPVFEWNKRKNTGKAYENKIKIAEEQYRDALDRINLEINSSYQKFLQAIEQVKLTESSLEMALENEETALDRYVEGKSSVVEVLDAQIYLQEARVNYIESKYDALAGRSDFIRALGIIKKE